MIEIEQHVSEEVISFPLRVKKDYRGLINLSSNEMPPALSKPLGDDFLSQLAPKQLALSKYIYVEETRNEFARFLSCDEDTLTLTPGSDPTIFYILTMLRNKHRDIYLQDPNYYNYERYAKILNYHQYKIPYIGQSETQFFQALEDLIHTKNKSLFIITNPNGITGEAISGERLKCIISTPEARQHLFILDCAYVAFSTLHKQINLDNHDNLILLTTYSKSHAAAGLRIGAVKMCRALSDSIKKFGIENTLSTLQLEYFKFIIKDDSKFQACISQIVSERERLIQCCLSKFKLWSVFPSQANFITIKVKSKEQAKDIQEKFAQHGILIKHLSDNEITADCVRISISDKEINNTTIQILGSCYDD